MHDEQEEEGGEEEEERRTTKLKFSICLFSASDWRPLGAFSTIGFLSVRVLAHFAVVFLELLPYRWPF